MKKGRHMTFAPRKIRKPANLMRPPVHHAASLYPLTRPLTNGRHVCSKAGTVLFDYPNTFCTRSCINLGFTAFCRFRVSLCTLS